MTSTFWLKLYYEILDDPKMGWLDDHTWRRTIELFLMAGEKGDGGYLPDIEAVAWRLRTSNEDVTLCYEELVKHKIIEKTDEGWLITKFADRQSKIENKDRQAKFRERQRVIPDNNDNSNEGVTTRYTDKIRLDKIRLDKDKIQPADVYKAYENNIGLLSGVISEKIDDEIKEFTPAWVLEAIEIATVQEKRSLSYVKGILKSWKRDGKNTDKKIIQESRYEKAKVFE